jgi:hypothetical protein
VREVGELWPKKLPRLCVEDADSPDTSEASIEECAEVSVAWALVNGADSMCGPAMKAASTNVTRARPVDQTFS